MVLYFCEECGIRLKRKNKSFYCEKCGKTFKPEDLSMKYIFYKKKAYNLEIMISSKSLKRSKIKGKCPYCGHTEARIVYYTVTRGDEDTLVLLECTSCKKVYREGYGY